MSGEPEETKYSPTKAGKNEYFTSEDFYLKAEQVFDTIYDSPSHTARLIEIKTQVGLDSNVLNVTLKRLRESGAISVQNLGATGTRRKGRYCYVALSRSKANLRPINFDFSNLMSTDFVRFLTPKPDELEVKGVLQNVLEKEELFVRAADVS